MSRSRYVRWPCSSILGTGSMPRSPSQIHSHNRFAARDTARHSCTAQSHVMLQNICWPYIPIHASASAAADPLFELLSMTGVSTPRGNEASTCELDALRCDHLVSPREDVPFSCEHHSVAFGSGHSCQILALHVTCLNLAACVSCHGTAVPGLTAASSKERQAF